MTDILLADIGGTTCRFALAGADGRPQKIFCFANDSVSDVDGAIAHALEQLAAQPQVAILAVAGLVAGDEIALTNRPWRFRLTDLRARHGFTHIRALNDFEALAFALPALGVQELRALGPLPMNGNGAKAVLGPGTGLGVGALVPAGHGWQVVASEGGHVSFGPVHADEEPVFARLRAERGFLSAECILSGRGLTRLHGAVNPGHSALPSEAIIAAAKDGDHGARATIDLFVRLLGRFAGDVALSFKATGGVYLAGGVVLGLGALLETASFRAAFEAHPPYERLLGDIPVAVMNCEEPGLIGCAAFARAFITQTE